MLTCKLNGHSTNVSYFCPRHTHVFQKLLVGTEQTTAIGKLFNERNSCQGGGSKGLVLEKIDLKSTAVQLDEHGDGNSKITVHKRILVWQQACAMGQRITFSGLL
jgi:hypothetical protein